jgi:SM-20-related protein
MMSGAYTSVFEKIAENLSTQNFAVEELFLNSEESRQIRDFLQQSYNDGQLKKAGIGTSGNFQLQHDVRGDHIQWIDSQKAPEATQIIIQRVQGLMTFINRACFLGLKDIEMHYTVYPRGTQYQRHLDQFKQNDHRRLTFICYLNPDWVPADGGCLRIYLPKDGAEETFLDVTPTAGKLVCFRSDILEHEVLLSYNERYSVTGWMLDQLAGLTFLK